MCFSKQFYLNFETTSTTMPASSLWFSTSCALLLSRTLLGGFAPRVHTKRPKRFNCRTWVSILPSSPTVILQLRYTMPDRIFGFNCCVGPLCIRSLIRRMYCGIISVHPSMTRFWNDTFKFVFYYYCARSSDGKIFEVKIFSNWNIGVIE